MHLNNKKEWLASLSGSFLVKINKNSKESAPRRTVHALLQPVTSATRMNSASWTYALLNF